MKNMKWFCRYAFLALLLLLSISFSVYCGVTLGAIKEQTQSIGFVDLALTSMSRAHQSLEQITYFEELLLGGIIVSVVIAAALALLVVWQLKGDRIVAALKEKKPAKKVKPAAPAKPAETAYFCPHCGARHDTKPAFCGSCGQKL